MTTIAYLRWQMDSRGIGHWQMLCPGCTARNDIRNHKIRINLGEGMGCESCGVTIGLVPA